MAYSDSPIQEIKERLDVVDIVREYVPLQQAGTNWRARCPFHNEKTPSFMVSKEKQIWHCFGCGKGGDVLEFVKEIEGIEFLEALRILAEKAGVVLKRQNPELISARTRLLDLMNEAVLFFINNLNSSAGEQARRYLAGRGLTNETLKEWQVGWANDDWESLSNYFRSKGFSDGQIVNSGLVVNRSLPPPAFAPQGGISSSTPPSPPLNRGGVAGGRDSYYDRFRGRIMFPLCNAHGNAVGFTGRILVETEKTGGKYVNTPQTMLYDKSRVIFGLDKAKQEIRKNDLVVVVEGQMDVIASHQAGVKNVVASSGTALTEKQLLALGRYTKNLAYSFDSDAAGEQATERGIDLAMQKGMNVKIIRLKGVKDPDECIKKGGVSAWQESIGEAVPIMKYYFDLVFGKADISSIEGRREVGRQLLGKIVKVGDRIEQDYWTRLLAERLGVDERILRESVQKIETRRRTSNISSDDSLAATRRAKPREVVLGERVVALGLKFPKTIEFWRDNFDAGVFSEDKLVRLAKSLIIYYNQVNPEQTKDGNKFDYNAFKSALEPELQKYAEVLLMLAEKDFGDLEPEMGEEEVGAMIIGLRKETAMGQLKKIETELKRAEEDGNKEKIEELSKRLGELIVELGGMG